MDFLGIIFIGLILLCIISGGYTFFVACLRKKEPNWLCKQDVEKTSFGNYYDYILNSNAWLSDHNAEEVFIEAADGIKLYGLWIPAENPRGTILFAHGYRSTYMVDFGAAMEFYHRRGMNLLLPCQRGHGKSQGRYITFGVKESRDMECWIAFHNEKLSNAPIILDGLSMGASTMLYMADRKLPDNVKGIIADCGFTSPKDIISHVFTQTTHLPAVPSIYAAELFTRLFAGFSLWECDTRRSLSGSRLPVLMVHGTGDEFVPHEMTKMGYDACTSEKKLLLAEGAGHGVSFIQEQERYAQLIDAFLEKLL